MKVHRLMSLILIMFFVIFGTMNASERSPEWYEERGLTPETEISEAPLRGNRTLREFPEGGLLLIPDSGNERIMAFDPETGDLLDADFIPSHSAQLTTPIQMVLSADQESLLLSDQSANVVHHFSLDGVYQGVFAPAGGANTSIMQNIRGMMVRDDGHALVTVASGDNAHSVAEFDTQGVYEGNFIANNAGGMAGPWSIIYREDFDDYLVSTSTSNEIHRFDSNGLSLGSFVPTLNFPQQLYLMENGNVLVATFSNPSGVYEFDSTGTQIGFYNPVTGLRGVYALGNGNILTTNSSGVYEINRQGILVDTKISGIQSRHISLIDPSGAYSIPFEEDFETGSLPEDWIEEQVEGTVNWTFQSGGHLGNPPSAYEGDFNALFHSALIGDITVLVTPPLNLGNAINPMLRFQHAQAASNNSQDELSIYYRIGEDGDWVLLENYDGDVPNWTEREIALPEAANLYYIGFAAESGGGHGVCIDLVEVYDHIFPIMEVTPLEFNIVLVEGENTTEHVTISNVGTADLIYDIVLLDPVDWLTIPEPSGIVPPDEDTDVDFEIDTDGLTAGENYTATMVVSDNYFDMEINVAVNLYVEELVLNPPFGLSAEVGLFYADLSWEAPESIRNRGTRSRSLLGYNVYRQDDPADDFDQINTDLVTDENYLDEDLDPGTYYYYVTAIYTQGESAPSETVIVIMPEQVAQPEIDPEPGEYEDFVEVSLSTATEDALIYYTLNGDEPDEESLLFEEPFVLLIDTVVKARAFKEDYFPSEMIEAEYTIVVSVDDQTEFVKATGLHAAYPNPFNPYTTIAFSIAEPGDVVIEIFNARGQRVKRLLNETREIGNYTLVWNGKDDHGNSLGSGIYFYRMIVNDFATVKKMILIQ